MNFGTKIRTVLIVATSLNTALMATDITGFNNAKLDIAYKITSVVLNFVIVACATYFNNDYTVEGETGTKITREMKENANGVYDWFYDEPEDSEVLEDDNE